MSHRATHSREVELVNEVLESTAYFNNRFTRRFEETFAEVHRKRVAIFVNSGTTAIDLAVHALKRLYGWRDGDEILVPAVTFVGTVSPVVRMGLKPIFVDVDTEHFDIAVDQIEAHITPRTRAIIPVHLFGQIAEMEGVMAVAEQHDLRVIEDACETMFVKRNGKIAGAWGDAACYSTFQAHMLATGIGGLVATDDDAIAVKVKALMNHANASYELSYEDGKPRWSSSFEEVPQGSFGETYDDIGYSFRASELEAAIGVAQMEHWEEILGAHVRNGERLRQNLADLGDRIQLPSARQGNEHGWFRFACLLSDESIDRDDFARHLLAAGYPCRWIFQVVNQPIYQEMFGVSEADYPGAELVNRRGIQLYCHADLEVEEMDGLSEAIHAYFDRH